MIHLLRSAPVEFLRLWTSGTLGSGAQHEGLLAFVSCAASTRTRLAVARASQMLGLDFIEVPWHGFYGNAAVHRHARGLLGAEARSMKLAGVRAIVARVDQRLLEELVHRDGPVVINGCSEYWHPLQSLSDLRALTETLGSLAYKTIAFIGNGSDPVLASLAIDGAALGCRVGC